MRFHSIFVLLAVLSVCFFQVQGQDVVPFTTIKTVLESGSQYPTTNIVINDSQTYNRTLISLSIRPEWVYFNRKTYVPNFTTNSILISSYMQYWNFRQQKITGVVRWGDSTMAFISYDSIAPRDCGVPLMFGYRYQIVEVPKMVGSYTVKLVKSVPIAKQQYNAAPAGKVDRGVTAIKLSSKSMVRYDALGRKTFMTPGQQKIYKKMTFQAK